MKTPDTSNSVETFLAFLDKRLQEKQTLMHDNINVAHLRSLLKTEVAELDLIRCVYVNTFKIKEIKR